MTITWTEAWLIDINKPRGRGRFLEELGKIASAREEEKAWDLATTCEALIDLIGAMAETWKLVMEADGGRLDTNHCTDY